MSADSEKALGFASESDGSSAGLSGSANIATPISALITCAILCLMPSAFALLTWQSVYEYTAIRHYSLPIVAAEAVIIVIAMISGFGLLASFSKLRLATKIAAIGWALAVLLATALASADPAAAQALFLTAIIHAVFFLAMIDRFSGPWRSSTPMLIRAVVLGLALYAVTVCLLAWSVLGDAGFEWIAFGAGVSNVRHLGYYGLALTGFAAGALAARSHPRVSDWPVACLFIGFFLTDWSGGRGAFCASIAVILCVVFFSERGKRIGFLTFALPLFLLAMPLSALLAPSHFYGAENMLFRLSGSGMTGGTNTYSSSRIDIWMDTWHGIVEQPWIGHADGQIRHLVGSANQFNHPHNSPLQFLYGWGIFGTAALAAMLWRPILNMAKAARKDPSFALPAIGCLSGLGAMSLLDGSLYYPLPVMMCLISLVMLHCISVRKPDLLGEDLRTQA